MRRAIARVISRQGMSGKRRAIKSEATAQRLQASFVLDALKLSAERLGGAINKALRPFLAEGEAMPDVQMLVQLVMRLIEARAQETSVGAMSVSASADDDELAAFKSLIEQSFGASWALWLGQTSEEGAREASAASEELLDRMKVALLRWGGEDDQANQIEAARAREGLSQSSEEVTLRGCNTAG